MDDNVAVKSILLLASNPKGTTMLRLQEEERAIKERLRLAGYGKVPINSTSATRTTDIQQAMLDFKPQIVHFTGHGAGKDGLAFEDVTGQLKLVDSEALANLFKLFSSCVECVVLNACYSEVQAEAIAQHINCVIGMSQAISDRAAIAFAVGFYASVGAGESVEHAYEMGCNAIQLEGYSGHLVPVLYEHGKLTRYHPGDFGILIDISHNQSQWDYGGGNQLPHSFFWLAKNNNPLVEEINSLSGNVQYEFGEIEEENQYNATKLKDWKGLIFGIPYHKKISQATHDAIVNWVRNGGRLLLLSYELGGRHHQTNFSWIFDEDFGIRFNSDIVAPENFSTPKAKPYGAEIHFNVIDLPCHPVLEGVRKLCMKNLSTLSVEPGSKVILTVGNNSISRQINPQYNADGWTSSGAIPEFELTSASWVPIIAEAPQDLTGKGSVLAIGTWNFLDADPCFKGADNYLFVRNLLQWLTGHC
jgi:hypothetical protein